MFNKFMTEAYHVPNEHRRFNAQFHEFVKMDKAHGAMLVKQGLLDKKDFSEISKALDDIDAKMTIADMDGELGDLYFNLTNQLYNRVGKEKADLIHVGRSRNDMECVCNRMQVRRDLLEIMKTLNGTMELMTEIAKQNIDTVVSYYTFEQPSQPGTLAHYLMYCFDVLARDFTRFKAAYINTNKSAMGGAAGIGSGYKLDKYYEAEILGFDGVVENSIDAISSVDYVLETQADITILATSLSRIAQDFLRWCSYEARFIDLDANVCGGSSIMPQKKNPEVFEQMRVFTSYAAGTLTNVLNMCKNTTMFPSLEATCEMMFVFEEGFRDVEKALGMLNEGLKASKFQKEKLYAYTGNNFTSASTMAEVLSKNYNVPFTKTHHIIGGMIKELMAKGTLEVKCMTGEMMERFSAEILDEPLIMTDAEVQKLADPMFCLEDKVTGGTPKPSDTEKLIANADNVLAEQKAFVAEQETKIANAYARIDECLK